MDTQKIHLLQWDVFADKSIAEELEDEINSTVTIARLLGYKVLHSDKNTDDINDIVFETIFLKGSNFLFFDLHLDKTHMIKDIVCFPIMKGKNFGNILDKFKAFQRLL